MGRVERGQCLGQPPETLIATGALLDEKSLEGLAATGGKQDHALVDAVQRRLASLGCAGDTPANLLLDFIEIGEQVTLHGLLLAASTRRGLRLILAEEVFGALGDGKQPGLVALDLDQVRQIFQVGAEALGDLAGAERVNDFETPAFLI
jgi:hypothetical protein